MVCEMRRLILRMTSVTDDTYTDTLTLLQTNGPF